MPADLIEETLSGAFLPAQLESEDAHPSAAMPLLCCGVRTVRVAFLEVQVYALGVYGRPQIIFGKDTGSITSDDAVQTLLKSKDEKVFSLTFLRSVSGTQVSKSLGETLANCGAPKDEFEMIASLIPAHFNKGSELRMLVKPKSSEVIIGTMQGETKIVPGVIRAIHEVYFGAKPVVKGMVSSVERLQPWLAATQPKDDGDDRDESEVETTARCELESSCDEAPSEGAKSTPLPQLVTIPSGVELQGASEGLQSEGATSPSKRSARSWKDTSGRTEGKDGYKFGDITRTLMQKKKRKSTSSESSNDATLTPSTREATLWPGHLTTEGEGESTAWVGICDVPELTAETLSEQSLAGSFYKHHDSPIRGRLVPQWSLRYYELVAGGLQYRRKQSSKLSEAISLDGARVVAEPAKSSSLGEFFVFRIVKGSQTLARLSCDDATVAREWMLAAAAACRYFRSLHDPGPGQETSEGDEDAETSPQHPAVTPLGNTKTSASSSTSPNPARETRPPAGHSAVSTLKSGGSTLNARDSCIQQSWLSVASGFFVRCQKMDPGALATLLVIMGVLLTLRRRRRPTIASS